MPTDSFLFPSPEADGQSIGQKIVQLGNQTSHLKFPVDEQMTIHGLAGYFHCTLYKDIEFSTVPEQIMTLSPGMFSWFPMYFPCTQPLSVLAGDEVDVHMWRCVDGRQMWYEWSVSVIPRATSNHASAPSSIQNSLGRSFRIQLS